MATSRNNNGEYFMARYAFSNNTSGADTINNVKAKKYFIIDDKLGLSPNHRGISVYSILLFCQK